MIAPIGRLVRSFESAESRILNAANDPGIGTCASSAHELASALYGFALRNPASFFETLESLWIQGRRRNGLSPDRLDPTNGFVVGEPFRQLLQEAFEKAIRQKQRRPALRKRGLKV